MKNCYAKIYCIQNKKMMLLKRGTENGKESGTEWKM